VPYKTSSPNTVGLRVAGRNTIRKQQLLIDQSAIDCQPQSQGLWPCN